MFSSCSNIQDINGNASRGFANCDGEGIVIGAIMNDVVFSLLDDSLVDLGKVAASCSGIHQASDVSPLFKMAKQALEKFTRNEENVSNPMVQQAICDGINGLKVDSVLQKLK